MSDGYKSNKLVHLLVLIECIVLDVAYAVETFVKGVRPMPFWLAMIAFTIVFFAVPKAMMKKNPDSKVIRWVIAGIFLLFYGMLLFNSATDLDFVYGIPFIITLVCYIDFKYIIASAGAVALMNLAFIISLVPQGVVNKESLAVYEIQFAALVIITVFTALVGKYFMKDTAEKVGAVDNVKNEIERKAEQTQRVVESLSSGISVVSEKMAELEKNTANARNSMHEISGGITEVADSGSEQLTQTENITKQIDLVSESTDEITNNVNETKQIISDNTVIMKRLVEEADVSRRAGDTVKSSLENLATQAASMNEIIATINAISSRTNLLALNASIEAARAGEAGRGFSVVATQISELSKQTQDATKNISEVLGTINGQIEEVVDNTETLLSNNNDELEGIKTTAENLSEIATSSNQIIEAVDGLKSVVANLVDANKIIVSGTSNISALSEEVASQSTIVNDYMTENLDSSEKIVAEVKKLDELAKSLA